MADTGLFAPRTATPAPDAQSLAAIRSALRRERKLHIGYTDAAGAVTQRVIWPVALGYFEGAPCPCTQRAPSTSASISSSPNISGGRKNPARST